MGRIAKQRTNTGGEQEVLSAHPFCRMFTTTGKTGNSYLHQQLPCGASLASRRSFDMRQLP